MEFDQVSKKLVSGFLTLTFRRASLYAIRFLTINIILARFLSPSTIGIFNLANSILSFFTFFSDIGLGAAIIQKKEITTDDLRTTFTIQQILSILLVIIIWVLAPTLGSFYNLDQAGVWLIRVLAFGFMLTSLKVLPAILLERELRFGPLVIVEIVETLIFCSFLIFLSFNNFGVNAFTIATLAQSLIGVILIYLIAPWKISIGISKQAAKVLLNFGVPFQLNSLLALLKDRLVPLVVARMIGTTGVGYVTWAQSLSFMPLEVMNIMNRLTFPAFSRLQHDPPALKQTLERSIFFISLLMYPLLFGLLAIAPSLVTHVVSPKWQPALPLIYLFSITVFFAGLSTSFTNFLNAIGKISITLKLMVFWTVLEWLLTPLLTYYYGYFGVALASSLIAFSSLIPIYIVKKMVKLALFSNIWPPMLAAIIMSLITYFLSFNFAYNLFSLILIIILGGIIYSLLILLFAKNKVQENLRIFKNVK